jgi:hypothetical protein
MTHPQDRISLGEDTGEDNDGYGDGPDLGPDERDADLLDGTWEQNYYAGRVRRRDWSSVAAGLGLLVLLAMVVPLVLVLFR